MCRGNRRELGESAIAFRAEVDGSAAGRPGRNAKRRLNQYPLTDSRRVDRGAGRDHEAACVGALDAREHRRRAGPAGILATRGRVTVSAVGERACLR